MKLEIIKKITSVNKPEGWHIYIWPNTEYNVSIKTTITDEFRTAGQK